jgi:predicted Zn finger-like uncharacterized protein
MKIVCPDCATSYWVDPTSIGEEGRQVRCARCRTIWLVMPPEPAEDERGQLAAKLAAAAANLAASENLAAKAESAPAPAKVPAATETEEGGSAAAEPAAPEVLPPKDEPRGEEPSPDPHDPPRIEAAPSIVPPVEQLAALPSTLPDPHQETESFAERRERLREKRRRERGLHMPSAGAMIFVLVLVLGGLIGWRKSIVRHAPQTASLYAMIGMPVNLRGVVFSNIRTSHDTQDGVPILIVEGMVDSVSNLPVNIPRLRFALRNEAGTEIYAWTAVPPKNQLASGERMPFRSRLASPPADARDVTVRFFTKYDVVAGVH